MLEAAFISGCVASLQCPPEFHWPPLFDQEKKISQLINLKNVFLEIQELVPKTFLSFFCLKNC